MRQVHRHSRKLISSALALAFVGTPPAYADSSGFSLPGVTLPSGHDEVRAADGTTCRSAVSGSGAYLDIGIIGNPQDLGASQSAYGRIVIPLGWSRRNRLDCSKLYQLEVDRLATELKLMQMGLAGGVEVPSSAPSTDVADAGTSDFDDDGWSTDGLDEN
ncbi:MAG: hypothetical protein AAFO77_05930 [Pseudomonadota bacterium]